MKRVTQFDTADEVLNAASRVRMEGDESPTLPQDTLLVVAEDGVLEFKGPGTEEFILAPTVTIASLAKAALSRLGIDVRGLKGEQL